MRYSIRNHKTLFTLASLALIGIVLLSGCPKKAEVTTTAPEVQKEAVTAPATPPVAAESAAAKAEAEAKEARERASASAAGLQPVYFEFNTAVLRADAKDTLNKNAAWLKANPAVKVRIEGNCDARGTKEYNQALGQKRSVSAKQYLVFLGIASNRISLVSYGKEKQVCTEETDPCWQKNRRDDFVALSQ